MRSSSQAATLLVREAIHASIAYVFDYFVLVSCDFDDVKKKTKWSVVSMNLFMSPKQTSTDVMKRNM